MQDIYGDKASEPVDILLNNFIANPYFFGNIFVAAVGVGPRQFDEMNAPCGNLYFSGDGMDLILHSTVHAALLHGRKTAARIVDILQGPLAGKFTYAMMYMLIKCLFVLYILVQFVNDSPRVEGNTIVAEFRTSRAAESIECIIPSLDIRMDCE